MRLWYQRLRALNYYRAHPTETCLLIALALIRACFLGAWWLVRKPQRLAVAIVTVSVWKQWGLHAATFALPASILAVTLVKMALIAERGTAHGFSAILSGVSRQWKLQRHWRHAARDLGLIMPASGEPVPAVNWRISQRGVGMDIPIGLLGVAESDIFTFTEKLRSRLFVDRIRAKKIGPGYAHIDFDFGEHLKRKIYLSDIPPSTRPGYLSVGIREDGEPLELPIGRSVLAAGLTGSGKSSFVWAVIYALIVSGIPFRLTIADPKFVEFKVARDKLGESPIVYKYTSSPADIGGRGLRENGFMWQIEKELTARLAKIPVGQREHVPTEEDPLDVLIIDETLPMAAYLRKEKEEHPISKVAYQGRAAGEWVICLSQITEKEVLGPIRDMIPIRLLFACQNRSQIDTALGEGSYARGAHAHLLDPVEDAGVCYMSTDTGLMMGARIGFATDEDTTYLVMGQVPPSREVREYELRNRQCATYKYYGFDDGDERVIYIGKAFDPQNRYKQHEEREPVMMAEVLRWDYEMWDSEEIALFQEKKMIRKYRPKWNYQHNVKYYRGDRFSTDDYRNDWDDELWP